jgi:predicted O-linked N-acetylglucosamine transferase (SPINDLY family)
MQSNIENQLQKALHHHEMGNYDDALIVYKKLLIENPSNFQVLNLTGLLLQQKEDHINALEAFTRAVYLQKYFALSNSNAGASALKLSKFESALEFLNNAIALDPTDAQSYINKGIVFHKLNAPQSSLNQYNAAISINPHLSSAYFNRAYALLETEASENRAFAQKNYLLAICISPGDENSYINLGNLLKDKLEYATSLKMFDRALNIRPHQAVAYFNRGTTFLCARLFEQAVRDLKQSTALDPLSYGTWNNLGNAYKEISNFDLALNSYTKALKLANKKEIADTIYNIGIVQHELELYSEAFKSFTQSLELNPVKPSALNARAITCKHLELYQEAISDFKKLLWIDPKYEYAIGNLIHTQMHLADWTSWDLYVDNNEPYSLKNQVFASEKVSHPFPVMALYDDPALHFKASSTWSQDKHSTPSDFDEPKFKKRIKQRIRIAYLSADFHNHATSYLMAELYERHNLKKFEIYALSFGPTTGDHMQKRIKASVEHFVDVKDLSSRDIANYCRLKEIDIAVDLKGYTQQSRFNIFVHRCAPIQISYLGYPGTSASSCIDYLIADRICISEKFLRFFSEKIIFLPNSYQVNDTKRLINISKGSRSTHGLPQNDFVFCCFNNTYKITPPLFKIWMEILKEVDKSVLWLLSDEDLVINNLKSQASGLGVDPNRLIFCSKAPLEEHLARHTHADLFLDTSPYNAHTTASDSLWAGLPVLTHCGNSFASRVAASLLNAVDLAELIAYSKEHYKNKAVELGKNTKKMSRLKSKLILNKDNSPLFDIASFTKNLEAAYVIAFENYINNKSRDHIYL